MTTDTIDGQSRLLLARAGPRDSGNYTCVPGPGAAPASVTVHVLNGNRCDTISAPAVELSPFFIFFFQILIIVTLDETQLNPMGAVRLNQIQQMANFSLQFHFTTTFFINRLLVGSESLLPS